ncbi:hypothetical protein [Latilactobacillus fuchuensis]
MRKSKKTLSLSKGVLVHQRLAGVVVQVHMWALFSGS